MLWFYAAGFVAMVLLALAAESAARHGRRSKAAVLNALAYVLMVIL